LVVPVVMEIPGHIMGSGLGGSSLEVVDYDIQTTCPETVEEYGLKKLRLGDLVAIRDHYDYWGRGRYEGAVTIGVVIHGFSNMAGHGPGLNPILSALPGGSRQRSTPMRTRLISSHPSEAAELRAENSLFLPPPARGGVGE